jgi:hypothetical protein
MTTHVATIATQNKVHPTHNERQEMISFPLPQRPMVVFIFVLISFLLLVYMLV